jgi:hypothetical protein
VSKSKNPLYVVNKNQVEEASGLVDYLVKKLNLEPAIEMLTSLFEFLLSQVRSYGAFVAVKEFIDRVVAKLELYRNFSII